MAPTQTTDRELVFLGSGAAIQIPAFFCSCQACEAARADPRQRRTRASAAVVGQEMVVIDAGPDLEFQLEREGIRGVDRVFITHWHYDHIGGLGALHLAAAGQPAIEVYVPQGVLFHFDQELAYMRPRVRVHAVQPGDRLELPDATWEVVKTTHTEHSVGYVVDASTRFAYLVDGITPPPQTIERLQDLDLLILEATVDELVPGEGQEWVNFSVQGAVDCWQRLGVERCILTHLSGHRWIVDHLAAGLSHAERLAYEAKTPGLRFAHDGMRVGL